MSLKLISGSNKKLRTKSKEVANTELELKKAVKFANKMLKTLEKYPYGCGLSAVQVGRMQRIFIIRYQGQKIICINPEIVSKSKKKDWMNEGCLSFPNQTKNIQRSVDISVKFYNGKEWAEPRMFDMFARIFQHEFDHLNGIVCMDKK